MRAIGAGRRQVLGVGAARGRRRRADRLGRSAWSAGIGVAAGLQGDAHRHGHRHPRRRRRAHQHGDHRSLVAGLGVSVASAVFPARRAAKVPPIAAMRDVAVDSSGSSRRRVVIGLGVTGARRARHGRRAVRWRRRGLDRPRCADRVHRRRRARPGAGPPDQPGDRCPAAQAQGHARARIARENAMRNPKRTSATAAALMIGVALVGLHHDPRRRRRRRRSTRRRRRTSTVTS